MFEKVNPSHPDKVADRIAGALVDLAYKKEENPKIAVEVLIGHGSCTIVGESSVTFDKKDIELIVFRIAGPENAIKNITVNIVPQDKMLADNQKGAIRCGDNGIFAGYPVSEEEEHLTRIARLLHSIYQSDGKYLIDNNGCITVCQSSAFTENLHELLPNDTVNPLGDWFGGTNVDTGATNRKLGSDMGRAVTGGGLHGKDLSKADVTLNIYAHLLAQANNEPVFLSCSIGDSFVNGVPYEKLVKEAKLYIDKIGGFEKFAEWGLIC